MTFTAFSDWAAAYKDTPPSPPGSSRLEKLPNELLRQILRYILPRQERSQIISAGVKDRLIPISSPVPAKKGLMSCMLTSQRMHEIALHLVYESVFIDHYSHSALNTFLHSLNTKPGYSDMIRTLYLNSDRFPDDLESEFPRLLASCSLLRSLFLPLGSFHIDGSQLFECRHLESLELLYHFGTAEYKTLFLPPDLAELKPAVMCPLSNLLLHDLDLIGGNMLELLLPRCPNLRNLELSGCTINRGALSHLHKSAPITKFICNGNRGIEVQDIVDLLSSHPALRGSLEVFALNTHEGYPEPRLPVDVAEIIRNLPPTLRSFRLPHYHVFLGNIPLLQMLSPQLEEFEVCAGLKLMDVEDIVLGTWYDLDKSNHMNTSQLSKGSSKATWLPSISDAVAVSRLQQRISSLRLKSGTRIPRPRLRHLDLCGVSMTVNEMQMSVLLGPHSLPLARIDLPYTFNPATRNDHSFSRLCAKMGWKTMADGCRIWIERRS